MDSYSLKFFFLSKSSDLINSKGKHARLIVANDSAGDGNSSQISLKVPILQLRNKNDLVGFLTSHCWLDGWY